MYSTSSGEIRDIGREGYRASPATAGLRPHPSLDRLPRQMAELSELFAECAEDVQAGIRDLGWAEPMPVQAKTIPLIPEESQPFMWWIIVILIAVLILLWWLLRKYVIR